LRRRTDNGGVSPDFSACPDWTPSANPFATTVGGDASSARLEVRGALYHVTARGNERRALFRDDADRREYLHRLARYREKFRFRLLSYCLMTNHVHLAIRTGEHPLSGERPLLRQQVVEGDAGLSV